MVYNIVNELNHPTKEVRNLRIKRIRQGLPYGLIATLETQEGREVTRSCIQLFSKTHRLDGVWQEENAKYLEKERKEKQKRTADERERIEVEKQRKEKQRLEDILDELETATKQIGLKKGNKAYTKTLEYFSKAKNSTAPVPLVLGVLNRYYECVEKGELTSLSEIGEEFSLWPTKVGRILKVVDEEAPNGSREIKRFTEYQEKAVQNALENTSLGLADIGYFAGKVGSWGVRSRNKNERIARYDEVLLADFGRDGKLPVRVASQIYEMVDQNIPLKKIIKKLKITPRVFSNAIENRPTYEPHIISELKAMYPQKDVQRPYVDFELK